MQGLDMGGRQFRIEGQNPVLDGFDIGRIALGGDNRGGQFPLAGAAGGVGLRGRPIEFYLFSSRLCVHINHNQKLQYANSDKVILE